MTLDQYIKVVNIFESEGEDLDKWVQAINYLEDIDSRSIPLSKFNRFVQQYTNELDIENLEAQELSTVEHNGEQYKVDTTIFTANVALFADYNIVVKRYKGVEQMKQILALLVYTEGEPDDYSYDRVQLNLQRIGDIELPKAISIVRFFFLLLKHYIDLSQISLVNQEMNQMITKHILEP